MTQPTQPGYQEGSERVWWWKVALHLDEAQRALANAMAHNVDDPRPVQALHDRLREGQAILLEIFRAKGLLPGSTNGKIEVPMPGMPDVPMPGIPGVLAAAIPASEAEQAPPLAAQEPAVSEADQTATDQTATDQTATTPEADPSDAAPSSEVAAPAAIPADSPPAPPSTDAGAGGAGG